jgi:hypothetical protein
MNALKRWIVRKEITSFVDNAIKESQMSPTVKSWLIGLANAAISTLATTVGTQVAGTTLKQTLIADGFALAISLSKWIYQHPIPGGTQ